MSKVRKIISATNQSNIINMHVLKKAAELKCDSHFLMDFVVRWNTSYTMLERFSIMKLIVDEITCNPQLINGIKDQQINKLRLLMLSSEEWELIYMMQRLLKPFYTSTIMLQGRKYETLALSKVNN